MERKEINILDYFILVTGKNRRHLRSMADEISGSQANYGFQDQGMEPPTEIVNQTAYQWGYWVYDPWLLANRALASIRDGLQSIQDLMDRLLVISKNLQHIQ